MKLDRLNEYVLITTVMVCGILLAIFCGRLSGTGNTRDLVIMAVFAISIIACLALRTRIWLLIPMFWAMSGQLNSAPGHLPFRDFVVILVVGFFFTLKAFKIIRTKAVYSWLDLIMVANILYVVSTYLRNPVGVNAFGSDLVGGRPYLEIIFAIGAYWVLSQVIMTPKQAKILPLLLFVVTAVLALISAITYLFPFTAPVLGKLYGGVDTETYNEEQRGNNTGDIEGDARAQFLAPIGGAIINLMTSFFSPLTMINPMYLWRFLLSIIAFFFCLKSGHRITIPAVAFTIFLATYFRKGLGGVIIMSLITIPPFVILLAGQGNLYELPETAQRTLSMFPGKWNPNVLLEAQGSTEWRTQMWEIVLHEKKYIHNKMFGDGFGFTRETLEEMTYGGTQEDFMLTGDVHSGPVSAIHTVGYVGLALFILLRIGCSIRSWRLIRSTAGTVFYPLALLVGIQTIYGSIGFVFIFGAYGQDMPNTIETVALLNLISTGFAAYLRSMDPQSSPLLPTQPMQQLSPVPVPALTR